MVRHGKRRPVQAQVSGALPGLGQHHLPPAQHAGRGRRLGVGQDREHERLGVPERMTVVSRAGQALGRDRAVLGARAGLQDVEQPEPDRLLDLRVAVDVDVGAGPEVVEVLALFGGQAVPADPARRPPAPRRPGP